MTRLFLICSLALFAQGCNLVVAGDDAQCSVDDDCTARGFQDAACVEQVCVSTVSSDPVWGCLDNLDVETPDPSKTISFDIDLVYAVGGAAVSMSTVVDVCDKLDLNCEANTPGLPRGLNPDGNGNVDITVPEGFDGFVQVTGPNLVDSRVYVGRPLFEPPSVEAVQLLSPSDFDLLATLAGDPPDPMRGTSIVLAIDCSGDGAGGIRFESNNADADTTAFYLVNQQPVTPPTTTSTDGDGFGGFFNMPVGPAVVRGIREDDDRYIGESSFQILAETISYVLVSPTPQ